MWGELFDNLIACGLNCFSPFRPEVMDVDAKAGQIPGTSRFSWGIVHQRALPFGSPEDVRRVSEHLLNIGAGGGCIFSPSRSVESDTSLANILAFIDAAKSRPGVRSVEISEV